MKKVTVTDQESTEGNREIQRLTDPLDTSNLALNRYRVPPGEGLPAGLHAHGDQEEVFVVLDGAATFETLDAERENAGEITVERGEAVRFAPGEYQSSRNAGEDDLVVLALGAPRDSDDVRIPLDCPECGHGYLRPEGSADGVRLVCPDCGAENVPAGCPECGSEMEVALGRSEGDAETVVVCPECGTDADTPFRE